MLSKYQRLNVTLGGNAIKMINSDPGFNQFQKVAAEKLANGQTLYTAVVTFGGLEGRLKSAPNELTWMLRHATVTATRKKENGNTTTHYHIYDTFDVHTDSKRGTLYNIISGTIGTVYHGMLNNSYPVVTADFNSIQK